MINYSKAVYGFRRVYVWGRSMGAVAALLLAFTSSNTSCQGMVLDSPFSSTKEMVILCLTQLCEIMHNVPNFILYMLFGVLGDKLKSVTGYDVMSIDLNEKARVINIPAFFMVADKDQVAGKHNVLRLFQNYGGRRVF